MVVETDRGRRPPFAVKQSFVASLPLNTFVLLPRMDRRGEAACTRLIDALDALATDHAVALVNSVARARRVSPHHLALAVPGLCHSHLPDERAAVPGCVYCARRGNCFARGPGGA